MFDDFDPNQEPPDEYDFLGRVDLDPEGHFAADIFGATDDPFQNGDTYDLSELFDVIGLEIDNQGDLLDLLTHRDENIEDIGFDFGSPDARGGYTREEVINFLDDTGWWGLADVYYDSLYEEYFLDLQGVSDPIE